MGQKSSSESQKTINVLKLSAEEEMVMEAHSVTPAESISMKQTSRIGEIMLSKKATIKLVNSDLNDEAMREIVKYDNDHITTLLLKNNQIDSEGAKELSSTKWFNLILLDLSFNQIDSLDSLEPTAFPSLISLSLNDNQLTDLPKSMSYLKKLAFLGIQNNHIKSVPAVLIDMLRPGKLKKIAIFNNEINVEDPLNVRKVEQIITNKVDIGQNYEKSDPFHYSNQRKISAEIKSQNKSEKKELKEEKEEQVSKISKIEEQKLEQSQNKEPETKESKQDTEELNQENK